jgi:hypothetical protein
MTQEKGQVIGIGINLFYQPKKLIQGKRYQVRDMATLGN